MQIQEAPGVCGFIDYPRYFDKAQDVARMASEQAHPDFIAIAASIIDP